MLKDGIFKSCSLQREMPYRIYLPDDYENDDESYPVLYLLHGLFGSFENWSELGDLENTVGDLKLIVVMPEGEQGWYCDGIDELARYEHYIVHDLIEHCDEVYRTKKAKRSRAVAGNSMGGYGAVKFALKFPERFELAYSSSGAFAVTNWNEDQQPLQWDEYRDSVSKIFGVANSRYRTDNDLFKLLRSADAAKLPAFYFDCGSDDKFLSANIALADEFRKFEIPCELEIIAGGHDWEYWSHQLTQIIKIVGSKLC